MVRVDPSLAARAQICIRLLADGGRKAFLTDHCIWAATATGLVLAPLTDYRTNQESITHSFKGFFLKRCIFWGIFAENCVNYRKLNNIPKPCSFMLYHNSI